MSTHHDSPADGRPTFAHISDTHVGYRAYRATAPNGRNQREEDFLDAWNRAFADIVARDVPLILHSGDVADHPNISYRLVKDLRDSLRQAAGIRPDGSRRQIVIVAGNHDLPGARQETCYLELFGDLPGVHVYTRGYERLDLGQVAGADPVLADIVIHAIPHDALADVDMSSLTPEAGRRNILVTHGTAGGTDLYRRCVGREYTIPSDVLALDWDYGALGHWHRAGPVDTGSRYARISPGTESRIWYAGSTENSGFGDLTDGGDRRGYLLVALDEDGPVVEKVELPIRRMMRGDLIDANGKDAAEITELLLGQLEQLDAAYGLTGAVVGQQVTGCSRDLWTLVDLPRIRARAARTLHHDLRLITRTAHPDAAGRTEGTDGPGGAAVRPGHLDLLQEVEEAGPAVDSRIRAEAVRRARGHLAARLNRQAASDTTGAPATGGNEEGDAGSAGADGPGGGDTSDRPDATGAPEKAGGPEDA